MGRPDEIRQRHLGDENNCTVVLHHLKTGEKREIEAHIPVFAGMALLAALDTRADVRPGDEVARRPNDRVFKVVQVLKRDADGRIRVELA